MTSMHLKAALFYASKGWPVLPVWPIRDNKCACGTNCDRSAGKHPISAYHGKPIVPRGLKNASTNPKVIKEWWSLIPDANIGCVGKEWFAIDVDDNDIWEMVCEGRDKLPSTPMQFTPSGGMHILFQQPENKIGNWRGDFPEGIDFRGPDGYILMAPSRGVDGEYTWELSSKPSRVPLAKAPEWIVEMVGSKPNSGNVSFMEEQVPDLEGVDISDVTLERILSPNDKGDRSSVDQQVVNALVAANCNDGQIYAIYNKYPVGTQGKYAEKGDHGDAYLALTISKARSFVKTNMISRAIPGKVITPDEAEIEYRVLSEAYRRGWNDALVEHPELAGAMWPDYLGLDNERMRPTMIGLYGLGFRKDFSVDETDREYAALVVPLTNQDGDVTNLDYSIYSPPEGIQKRQWEEPIAPVFIADAEQIGRRRLLVLDDWDIAAYIYLELMQDLPDDIALAAMSSEMRIKDLKAGALRPLLALANESEQVIYVRRLRERSDARLLAHWTGQEKSKWIGWPMGSRDMFRRGGMNSERLNRAIRGALPIV